MRPASKPVNVSLRSRIPYLLVAALLGCALSLHAEEKTPEPPTCQQTAVEEVERRHRKVKDLRVRFVQTSRSSVPDSPASRSNGHAILALPNRMRWTYESPEESLLVSDGKTLWLFDPGFREVQRLPVGDDGFLGAAAAQFLLGRSNLVAEFQVRTLSCDSQGAVLELLPRKPASYQRLTLATSRPGGDIAWTEVVDLLGNTTRLDFSEPRFDTGPEASLFVFDPPPGASVIDLVP